MNNLKIMRFLLLTYNFSQNILQVPHFRNFLSCNNPVLHQDVPLATLCFREAAQGRCLGCPSRWLSQDYSNRKIWGTQDFKFSGTETTFFEQTLEMALRTMFPGRSTAGWAWFCKDATCKSKLKPSVVRMCQELRVGRMSRNLGLWMLILFSLIN